MSASDDLAAWATSDPRRQVQYGNRDSARGACEVFLITGEAMYAFAGKTLEWAEEDARALMNDLSQHPDPIPLETARRSPYGFVTAGMTLSEVAQAEQQEAERVARAKAQAEWLRSRVKTITDGFAELEVRAYDPDEFSVEYVDEYKSLVIKTTEAARELAAELIAWAEMKEARAAPSPRNR